MAKMLQSVSDLPKFESENRTSRLVSRVNFLLFLSSEILCMSCCYFIVHWILRHTFYRSASQSRPFTYKLSICDWNGFGSPKMEYKHETISLFVFWFLRFSLLSKHTDHKHIYIEPKNHQHFESTSLYITTNGTN